MSGENRAVFLDRDGVLNAAVVRSGRPYSPASADEVVLLPGVVTACRDLAADGWMLLVVTNQPTIARGQTTREAVDQLNELITEDLGITEVIVCPHDDTARCRCRKPEPGMIESAVERWGIDPTRSVMIGDRWRDVECGRRAGTTTIFVDHHYDDETRPDDPDYTVASLADAVPIIRGL